MRPKLSLVLPKECSDFYQLWGPNSDTCRLKVGILFTPKDRSVSLDYEGVKISVTFGPEVLLFGLQTELTKNVEFEKTEYYYYYYYHRFAIGGSSL